MYLTFDQVLLVRDKSKVREGDSVVYERQLRDIRILTPDPTPAHLAGDAKRYGMLYFDADENPCVVPDVWDVLDAAQAKDYRDEG